MAKKKSRNRRKSNPNPNPDPKRNSTRGELLVGKVLSRLPRKDYYAVAEPRIILPDGRTRKPDFVVVARQLGVIVIEIKDWKRLVGATQQYVTIAGKDGTTYRKRNPVDTAEGYAYDLNARFEQRSELMRLFGKAGERKLRFPWQAVVILPNIPTSTIRRIGDEGIWSHKMVLGKEALASPSTFETMLHDLPWEWRLHEPLSDRIFNFIRGVVNPELVVTDEAGQDTGGTLTEQQEAIAYSPITVQPETPVTDEAQAANSQLNVQLVRGVAGSGKTLVLVHRARYLAEHHPDLRVLVLTYDEALAGILSKQAPQVEIADFRQACVQILGDDYASPVNPADWITANASDDIKAADLEIDFVLDEIRWRKETGLLDNKEYLNVKRSGRGSRLVKRHRRVINDVFERYLAQQRNLRESGQPWADWEDVPVLALESVTQDDHPLHHAYDVIMVDEAQDFAPLWLDVIKNMLKPGGSFFICEDPAQSIYRYYSWQQKGIAVVGRTRILITPFRSTRQINITAHSLIKTDPVLSNSEDLLHPEMDSPLISEGDQPTLALCRDSTVEAAYIERRVQALIDNGTLPQAIAVLCHAPRDVKRWAHLRDQHVFVEPFNKVKGLEFQAVFLPDLQGAFSNRYGDAASEMLRKVFVAMTRARRDLTITIVGNLPDALKPITGTVDLTVIDE